MSFTSTLVSHVRAHKVEYIVGVLTALTAGLFLVIWQAWLFEVLKRNGEAIPRQALGAIIGLLLIFLLASLIYNLYYYRLTKQAKPEQLKPAPDFIKKFTVKWDTKTQEPHCPVCLTELAQAPSPTPDPLVGYFRCIKCNQAYLLQDATGNYLSLETARSLVFPIDTPHKIKPKELPSLPPSTLPSAYQPDDLDTNILVFLGHPQHGGVHLIEIANKLNLKLLLLESRLEKLQKEDYVKLSKQALSTICSITPKGIKFLNQPVRKVPHPNVEGFRLGETHEKILILIARPDCQAHVSWMSVALEMHPERLQLHLAELKKNDYVIVTAFHSLTGEAWYELTNKAREFLLEKGHI